MRWPWVSRRHHEEVVGSLRRLHHDEMCDLRLRADDTIASITRQDAVRYDALLDKYLDFVTCLAHPVIGTTTITTPTQTLNIEAPPPPVDAIAKTIREEAGRDTHLAQHLRKYARELKAQGLTEDEIVGKLVAWQTSEPEDHVASA